MAEPVEVLGLLRRPGTKETQFDAPTDPQDPPTWTGTWRDPRFSPPADGGRPENGLTGQYFIVNSGTTDIQVPAQYGRPRLWRNTAAANLTAGQTLTLGPGVGTRGYEWDEDADDGARPAGLLDLSSTTSTTAETFIDYGTSVASPRTATHLTMYRAAGGALVFGAGTVQWGWGMDNGNPRGTAPDSNMQQATVNLFADMGVQPASLIGGLGAATASTDTTPLPSSVGPGKIRALGSPGAPVWLSAPCSTHGLGGAAPGAVGA